MTGAVWKYPIPFVDEFWLEMPLDAELLFVDQQHEQGCLWARVNLHPDNARVARQFFLRGTGHQVDLDCKYIGSFIIKGPLVFHLFEAIRPHTIRLRPQPGDEQ